MTVDRQDAPFIVPDGDLIARIHELGAGHASKCYQCGTCSAVCPITPLEFSFPRKEMLWAQWGLKDKILTDMDVWLCYQCNDCVTYCPTDARPGDVMAAIRNYQMTSYATPQFLAKASLELKYVPLAFVIPTLIVVGIIVSMVLFSEDRKFEFPDGRILFSNFIPEIHIDIATFITLIAVFTAAGVGLYRFWQNIQDFEGTRGRSKGRFLPAFGRALLDVFSHSSFKECGTSWTRLYAHLSIFYGFLLLIAATTGAFIYTVVLPAMGMEWSDGDLSLPLWDPVKIIGNVGGVALLAGATWSAYLRLTHREAAGTSIFFDWFFVALIMATTLTGFILMALRYADLREAAYSFYLVHLLFVYTLFVYFPFSKFSHLMYHTLAMTHAYQTGRKVPRLSPARADRL